NIHKTQRLFDNRISSTKVPQRNAGFLPATSSKKSPITNYHLPIYHPNQPQPPIKQQLTPQHRTPKRPSSTLKVPEKYPQKRKKYPRLDKPMHRPNRTKLTLPKEELIRKNILATCRS